MVDAGRTVADATHAANASARSADELERLRRAIADLENEVAERSAELSLALRQQNATAELLKTISRSTFELQDVLDRVTVSAAHLAEADMAAILRSCKDGYRYVTNFGIAPAVFEYCKTLPLMPGRGSCVGRVLLEHATVHIPDAVADPEFTDREAQRLGGFRTMLGVPLLREGQPLGVVVLWRTTVKPFTTSQIDLVTSFADQAVIAIENVRLSTELEARDRELNETLQQQTATAEILRAISISPTDARPVFEIIVRSAVSLCGSLFANVFRFDGEFLHLAATHNVHPVYVELLRSKYPMRPDTSQISGRVILERSIVRLEDALADADYDQRFPLSMRWRRVLGVPMLREGDAIGVIVVGWAEAGPVSRSQEDLLTTFADQAVIAIENVRLFEAEQARTRELEEALHRQTATADVLKVISRSTFNLDVVLDTLTRSAAHLSGAECATILRLKGDSYHFVTNHGISSDVFDYLKSVPLAPGRGSVVGRVLLKRTTVHLPDVLADPEYTYLEQQHRAGYRTMLGVPLLREGEPVGVILLWRETVQPFTERHIEMVTTFADQAVIAIENARLFEEVRARTGELEEALEFRTATGEVLGVISRSPSQLQPVLDAIVSTAARLCQASYAMAFALRDGHYHLVAADENAGSEFIDFARAHPLKPGRNSLVARTAQERRTIHLPDCLADQEYTNFDYQRMGQYRTALGVPLLRDDFPIGVIALLRTAVEPFSRRQIELVETFADQALIAIENARLFEEVRTRTSELQEALDHQTATSEVLSVISRSKAELHPVLEIVIESATRLCGATRGQIFRFDGSVLLLAASHGAAPGFTEYLERHPTHPGPGSVSGLAAAQRRTIHIPDVLAMEGYAHKELLQAQEFRTALGVPIQREDLLLGVIVILKSHVEPFTPRQIELVETFADQAVIAIENARLFEEVQARTSELGRSLVELKALAEVGRTVSSSLDLPTVLGAILKHACEISQTGGGAVYVLDPATGELTLEAGYNMSEELISAVRHHRIRIGDPIVGECARSGEPVQLADVELADDYPLFAILRQSGIRALLAVPLVHQGVTIGVLLVRRRRAGGFEPATVSLLQAFASQSSLAINNARLFQEIEDKRHQIEIASQHKSQFLANMSHELRTPLNAILGYTELMQDGIYGELPEKLAGVLDRVQSNGRHLLGLINDVLDLSKIEAGQLVLHLDEYALSGVVRTVATATESLAREKQLAFRIDIAEGLPTGRGDERRIAQVLLNLVGNAIKFTDRGEVRIRARSKRAKFVVTVSDTGPGIALSEQARIFDEFHQIDNSNTKSKGGTGLGLAISKRIVEMHGGRLSVHSEPESGATFRLDLPIRVERQRGLV